MIIIDIFEEPEAGLGCGGFIMIVLLLLFLSKCNSCSNNSNLSSYQQTIPTSTNQSKSYQENSTLEANTQMEKPDVERLEQDLIGHVIKEQSDGYFGSDWYWTIEPNEIKQLTISSIAENGNNYLMNIHLLLQGKNEESQYEADIAVTYVLRQNRWLFDFLESKTIGIVKTGKYDNCITAQVLANVADDGTGGIVGEIVNERPLVLTNRCDVTLLVGGRILTNGEWKKFAINVESSNKTTVALLVEEYRIDFIERR